MNASSRSAAVLAAALAAACAHFPVNEPLPDPAPTEGYRFDEHPLSENDKELFVVLTLSGGGTRAAALAYAVMKELRDTPLPGAAGRSLLDEVDVVSSVSGGSFTAAWYGLHGAETFDGDFEKDFLRHDVQGDLFWRFFHPLNWFRLPSSNFDRIDMAAEYYDEEIFDQATYDDLLERRDGRPFTVINATDMSIGSRFEFTQDQFDLLHSDLSDFPVGRAAAASSAFPVLLSPVRLVNHPDGGQLEEPGWVGPALASRRENESRYRRGRDARSYLETETEGDAKKRRYIHLLDGGISDNIGLRGTHAALSSNAGSWSLLDLFNNEEVKRLVVIVVNAKTETDTDWDRSSTAPGIADVLMTTATAPMDNYSAETIDVVSRNLERMHQDVMNDEALSDCLGEEATLWDVAFNFIHLTFDSVEDDELRDELQGLPTSFSLSNDQVDLLLEAGPQLLRDSPAFGDLMDELRANSEAGEQ